MVGEDGVGVRHLKCGLHRLWYFHPKVSHSTRTSDDVSIKHWFFLILNHNTAYMKMSDKSTEYRHVRHAGQQGTRPPVLSQAGVEKYATGCGTLSMPSKHLD